MRRRSSPPSLGVALVAALTAPGLAEERNGVVLETAAPESALAIAGLAPGDRLVGWQRAGGGRERSRGTIASIFDWHRLAVETAPLGAVRLTGVRQGAPFSIEVMPGLWEGRVRPAFQGAVADADERARALLDEGRRAEAVEVWQEIATGELPAASIVWLHLRIAEERLAVRDWDGAHAAYRAALASSPSSWARAHVWEATAEAFVARGELEEAEVTLMRALEIRRAEPGSALAVGRGLVRIAELAVDRRMLERAEALVEEALPLLSSAAKGLVAARGFSVLGAVAFHRGRLDEAEGRFEQALAIEERLAPGSLPMATSLNRVGAVAWRRGQLERAESFLERSLAIREARAPESLDVAGALNNLGLVAHKRGALARAEARFRRAAAIQRALEPGGLALANTLNNLGMLAMESGDLDLAERRYRRALELRQAVAPGSIDVAASLSNLGLVEMGRGELAKAEASYRQALAIRQEVAPESLDVANSLATLATLARRRGDLERARADGLRALAIQERLVPGSFDVAMTLTNVALVARDQDDLETAAAFNRRAVTIQGRLAPESLDMADMLNNSAVVDLTRGDLESAREQGEKALAIHQRLAPDSVPMSATLLNLAEVAARNGDAGEALALHRQALAIRTRLAPDSLQLADSLFRVAELLRGRGELAAATDHFERSLAAFEGQVGKLGTSREGEVRFRALWERLYRRYVDHLVDAGALVAAFDVVERFRGRSFLAMLAERDVGFGADIPEALDRRRRQVAARYDRVSEELAGLSPAAEHRVEALLAEQRELRRQRDEIVVAIRRRAPRLAELRYPRPLSLEQVRSTLAPGTLLLSYCLGEESSHLFAVGATTPLEVYVVPSGSEGLRREVELFRRLVSAGAGPADRRALDGVDRRLFTRLIAPVAERVAAAERLLVVPDGPLHLLPFGALRAEDDRFLVELKPVHVALSATVHAQLQRRGGSLPETVALELVAFADPETGNVERRSERQRSLALPGSARSRSLGPLPASRREVEAIAELFPTGARRVHLGSEATEDRVRAAGREARRLHFATHGILDPRFPLDSGLVLTASTSPGDGESNGFLQAWEILDSVRLDADLVVLSACETGLGSEQGGEGLIGLTRAFHYAGARSVLSTLWRIDDEATAELMVRFYGHLRRGLPKDEALQAAQVELIRGGAGVDDEAPGVTHPYFWAAWQLHGDWR